MKKYLSLFLVLAMLSSSMPLSAFAEGVAQENEPAVETAAPEEKQEEKTEEPPATSPSEKQEEKTGEPPAASSSEKQDASQAPAQEEKKDTGEEAQKSEEQKPEEQKPEEQKESEPAADSGAAQEKEDEKQNETSEPAPEEDQEPDTTLEEGTSDPDPVDEESDSSGDTAQGGAESSGSDDLQEEDTGDSSDSQESADTGEETQEDSAVDENITIADAPLAMELMYNAPVLLSSGTALGQVEGVSATTYSATAVRIRWYLETEGTGYEVQRSTASDFTAATTRTFSTTIDDGDLILTGLTCGQTYYYRVRVYDSDGEENVYGPWSKVVSYRTSPKPPEWVKAKALSATSVQLEWGDEVSEASGYIVMRDGTEIYRTSSKATRTYKDTGLTTGVRYNYRVYSYKTVNGEAVISEEYAEYYDSIDDEIGYVVVPPAPEGLSTKSAGLASIALSWKKVDGVEGYNIYRAVATTENFEKWGTVSGADVLAFTDSRDIATGDEYRYYVTSYVSNVESKPSNIETGKARPDAPKNLTATYKDSTSIRISWDSVPGARGYILESSNAKDGSYDVLMVDSKTEYLDSGLSVGEERFYRVRAYVREYGKEHVESDNSIVAWEMTRPVSPKGLTLTNTAYNKIKVSWQRPEGADGYQVERSTDGTNWTTIKTYDSVSESPYVTSTNLTCGQTYYYRVRALVYSSDRTSRYPGPYSEVQSAVAKPAATEQVSATRVSGENAFQVEWAEVSDVDGYRVYYKQYWNGSAGSPVLAKTVSSTVYSAKVTGLKAGYQYQFIVLPYRNVNGTKVSGAQTNSELKKLEIDRPTELKRTAIDLNSFKLSWKAIGGIDGYEVHVEGEDDPSFAYDTDVTTNSVTIENVIGGYNYLCRIRAYTVIDGDREYRGDESKGWSEEFTAWATATPPTGLSARTLYDSFGVRLTWNQVEGATGYIIRRSTSADSGYSQLAKLEGSSITQYDDLMSLDEVGTKYYYTICSYTDAIGSKTSPFTNAISMTAQLPRPTLTLSNAGVSKATLTWTSVDGADGYAVYRATSSSGPFTQIGTFSSSRDSCTATGLTTGKTYYFCVAAYYEDGSGTKIYGVKSLAKSIIPSPIAPTGLSGTAYGQSAVLTWNKLTGVSGYRIYRATGTGSYVAIADVTGTTYSDNNLKCGLQYRYKVAAYMNTSSGKAVGVSCSPIELNTALTVATNLLFTVTSATQIKLTWNAVRDADGYVIQRASSEEGPYTTIGTVKNNYCTISGMPTGQYRYIRVKAYVDQDGERIYCNTWSGVKKTVSKPMAVTNLTCTNRTSSRLSVNWTKAAGATGYRIYYRKSSDSVYTLAETIVGDVTAYQISGLSSGTKYYIKIIATCEDTYGNTLASNKSAIISATTK